MSAPASPTAAISPDVPGLPAFWAVLAAAGIGTRMGADRPKQYLQLCGKSILEHSLACFLDHPQLRGLVVSLAVDDPFWATLVCASDARIERASGGVERADSVLNALLRLGELGAQAQDWVLVHDAARPNLARTDLDKLLGTLAGDTVGGLLGVPVRDTIKRVDANGRVLHTVDRQALWHAYTPQMFRLGGLRAALEHALAAGATITDEASALEWAGQAPRMVQGRADNLKITQSQDLQWLRQHWAQNGCQDGRTTDD
ncbi:MAG: 2-C-methyl-D-erythritol 4-phosphate cytidylyltransferase [Pseudomonas sp.]